MELGTEVLELESLALERYELRLVHPLQTATERHDRRPIVLVRIVTTTGEGIGECAALAEPTYTEEWADGAEALLADQLLPRFGARRRVASITDGLSRLDAVRGHPMAKAAIEMALLDALLRAASRSLASFLGAGAARVGAGATVSLGDAPSVLAAVEGCVAAGYRRVKVKIAPGRDVAPLAAVRAAYPDLVLVADANGSYDPADAAHRRLLEDLDGLGLAYLEQPTAPGDLGASAAVAAGLATPVLLDEGLSDAAGLDAVLSLRAADGVVVKPARLGGLLPARALLDRLVAEGLEAALGGLLESGVGRAAALALGALDGFTMPGELGASDRYFAPDLTPPFVLLDGSLAVPDGPGLGVDLDPAAAEAALERRVEVRLP